MRINYGDIVDAGTTPAMMEPPMPEGKPAHYSLLYKTIDLIRACHPTNFIYTITLPSGDKLEIRDEQVIEALNKVLDAKFLDLAYKAEAVDPTITENIKIIQEEQL
jgi:hypothetical protein